MPKSLFKVVGEGPTTSFEIADNAGTMQILIDGSQTAVIADATGTADSITRINLIIDALQNVGIVAT